MRSAVSGTHFIGKSTLIADFIKAHPDYKSEIEPYYNLQDETAGDLSLEPTLDNLIAQLNYSIKQILSFKHTKNIIFDRCPVDFLAYAMCSADLHWGNFQDSEIAELFPEIKEALNLNQLDLIVFLPISKENQIDYDEDNPEYRKETDKYFKKIYRDDIYDIFPSHCHPRVIEITGTRTARIRKIESYLA